MIGNLKRFPCAGMDLTPVETVSESDLEGQDPQAHAEGLQKRRILALIDKVSSTIFSYVAQVDSWHRKGRHIPAFTLMA